MPQTVLKKRKRSWLRLLVEILVIIAIVLSVRYWFQRDLPSGKAPDFQAVLMDGKLVNLEDYRGEPLLLTFWATWCKFCTFSESSITDINKDWQVLTVAYQSGEKEDVAAHIDSRNLDSWDVIPDQDGRLAELFGVKAVPASYIIDGKGNIKLKEVGVTTGWGLKARLWYAKNIDDWLARIGLNTEKTAAES
ncbi:redoxin domain-containing protein [Leucothrix sargassi]|nr:redoxin domain-containing protein [Leucothrix sargassi]